jgi:hypothetical protein
MGPPIGVSDAALYKITAPLPASPRSLRPSAGRLALAVPFVALAAFAGRFVRLGVDDKMSYVPDDAFYYMQLGSEFQRSGRWSFDRGRTLTAGFHPLFGYLSAAVERCLRDRSDAALDARLCVHAALATATTLAALAVLASTARRAFPRGVLAAMLFVGCAGGVFLLPFQAMEWPYAVLAGALLARAVVARRAAWIAPAIVFGCLARTDFVVEAGCLAVAVYSVDPRLADPARRARLVAAIAGGAAGGLAVGLHAWTASGQLVQSSARMKAHWGAVLGYQPLYGLEPASYALSPGFLLTRVLDFGPATLMPVALGVAVLAWSSRESAADGGWPSAVLFRFGALTAVAYPLVYGRIGATAQCWYSAHFVPALFLLVAGIAHAATDRARRVFVGAGLVLAAVNAWDARRPPWNAAGVMARARSLGGDPAIEVAAAWNAGTRGFLGGEKVVNIDGLVNDDVYPYVVRDRLHCYLVHEGIPFLVDDAVWPTPLRSQYLGFANGRLLGAMTRIDAGGPQAVWSVDLAALARDPACADDLRPARSRGARPRRDR